MQQNLYCVILEDCYGIRLDSMHLVQIHPDLPEYKVVDVPDLRELARLIFRDYAATLVPGVRDGSPSRVGGG